MIRKGMAAIAAAFMISIQLFPAVSFAQSAWTGDSWQGDPWKGEPWTKDPYNGANWSGTPIQPNSGWNANSWEGTPYTGSPGANESGFNGNSYSGNPFLGAPGSGGSPFQGGAYQGQPFVGQGNAAGATGFQGNPFQGTPTSTVPAPSTPSTAKNEAPGGFEIAKLTVNDLLAKNVDMYASLAHGGGAGDYFTARGAMALSGFKTFTQGNDPAQAIGDLGDMGFKTKETIDAFNEFKQVRLAAAGSQSSLLSAAGNGAQAAAGAIPAISTLAKVNAATGVIGLGFSSVELYRNVTKASNSSGSEKTDAIIDSVGNAGDILMSGGAIAAAIPGGQALGFGLMAIGGTISIGTAAVKFFRRKSVQNAIKAGLRKLGLKFGG